MSHFVEESVPVAVIALSPLTPLDAFLVLGAMRFGIPAIVSPDFPYEAGFQTRIAGPEEVVGAVLSLGNMRLKTRRGATITLPAYANPAHAGQELRVAAVAGGTAESYIEVRAVAESTLGQRGDGAGDGPAENGGVFLGELAGRPLGLMVLVSHDALDAPLLHYIETFAIRAIDYLDGVKASAPGGRLELRLAESAASSLTVGMLTQAVQAGLLYHFGRLKGVRVHLDTDEGRLRRAAPAVMAAREVRDAAIGELNEETAPEFHFCTGCSTFALDHVCIITPERVPMCGRNWVQIKAGAYLIEDDLSRSFRRRNQANPSSTGVVPKGKCLDAARGEWEGVNEVAARESGGRIQRVFLHSLYGYPHSNCSCFLYLVFDMPSLGGYGIMHRNWEGRTPDGRTWADLALEAAGRQRRGIVGANLPYVRSRSFLQADGGLKKVVWMTGRVYAQLKGLGADLPPADRLHVD